MSWPYVAQDPDGGWYGDCEGVMQNSDPKRTQVQAMQWCIDRLAHKLGSARHGCEFLFPLQCLIHKESFSDDDIEAMRYQMRHQGLDVVGDELTPGRIVRVYERWITQQIKASKQ